MELDVLVFAAHPDDAELSMGGTIHKLAVNGKRIGIVDLCEGELGTRGNVETRKQEATDASKILKLTVRENLGLPDGEIRRSKEYVKAVVREIRKYKPKIIFAPFPNDRHPDHIGTSQIVKEAMFFSGVNKFETEINGIVQNPYRPNKLFYYMQTFEFKPSFIVDISQNMDSKMDAVRAYKTQFYDPNSNEPETFISNPLFIQHLETRAKYYGFLIRKLYGEPFYSEEDIELDVISLLQ